MVVSGFDNAAKYSLSIPNPMTCPLCIVAKPTSARE